MGVVEGGKSDFKGFKEVFDYSIKTKGEAFTSRVVSDIFNVYQDVNNKGYMRFAELEKYMTKYIKKDFETWARKVQPTINKWEPKDVEKFLVEQEAMCGK